MSKTKKKKQRGINTIVKQCICIYIFLLRKNYAIIINMAKKDSLENADEVIKMLFSEIPEEKQCPRSRVILLGIVEDLDEEDNVFVSPDNFKSEAGVKLSDFLDKVPTVNIRSENVNDINIEGL